MNVVKVVDEDISPKVDTRYIEDQLSCFQKIAGCAADDAGKGERTLGVGGVKYTEK